MIPLALIPWRLIGAGALVAAVALMGWRVNTWHESHKALQGVRDALEREEGCLDGSMCQSRQKALQEAVGNASRVIVETYEQELADVRGRKPISVRVCDRGGVPNAADAGAAGGPAATAGVLSGQAAGDREIGPALSDLAREADEVSARLRALQGFNAVLAK